MLPKMGCSDDRLNYDPACYNCMNSADINITDYFYYLLM